MAHLSYTVLRYQTWLWIALFPDDLITDNVSILSIYLRFMLCCGHFVYCDKVLTLILKVFFGILVSPNCDFSINILRLSFSVWVAQRLLHKKSRFNSRKYFQCSRSISSCLCLSWRVQQPNSQRQDGDHWSILHQCRMRLLTWYVQTHRIYPVVSSNFSNNQLKTNNSTNLFWSYEGHLEAHEDM